MIVGRHHVRQQGRCALRRGYWATSGVAQRNWQRLGFHARLQHHAQRVLFTWEPA
jgi:hypothetical protein